MRRKLLALGCVAASGLAAAADDEVVAAGGQRPARVVHPPLMQQPVCPPGTMPGYLPPATLPGTIAPAPGAGTPAAPGAGTPETPGTLPTPPALGANTQAPGQADPNSPLNTLNANTFAQGVEAGGQPSASFNPNMFGDFAGVTYTRVEDIGPTERVVGFTPRVTGFTETVTLDPLGNKVVTRTPIVVNDPIVQRVPNRQVVRVPLATRYSGVKIQDAESPRPVDRVWFAYNYFDNLNRSLNSPNVPNIDSQRQTIAFEKTFLGGDASVGMRLPFVQVFGPGSIDSREVGDLSVNLKFAWINDLRTGNVLSTGLVVTAPTGSGGDEILVNGQVPPHSTLFQPWAGFIQNRPDLFLHGFSSIIVPSDSRDPTVLFNSLGLGYWLYRNPADRMVNGILPTLEMHVNTPLNKRDPNGPVYLQDQVNITGGGYILLPRSAIGAGVCVPVVGPRPWNIEALVNVNFRF